MNLANLVAENPVLLVAAVILAAVLAVEFVSTVCNEKHKRFVIMVVSVGLMGWLDAVSCLVLAVLATGVFLAARRRLRVGRLLYPAVLAAIGGLICIKDFGAVFQVRDYAPPLGVSYYFFRLISFFIEYAKKPERMSRVTALDFYSWVFFFPVLLAGPIIRFSEFKALAPEERHFVKPRAYRRLLTAVCAKVLLVDMVLFRLAYEVSLPHLRLVFHAGGPVSFFSDLMPFSLLAFLHAYMDLASYTGMSVAVSNILGFSNVENFNRPLAASNISQFWQRWHMSLSNWTRDYVYFPALVKTRRPWLCTYASMLTIGMWHSLSAGWVVWALLHATAINAYGAWRRTKFYRAVAASRSGSCLLRIAGMAGTITFVATVFIFVAGQDFSFVLQLFVRILSGGENGA